jgi:hypothetical protein
MIIALILTSLYLPCSTGLAVLLIHEYNLREQRDNFLLPSDITVSNRELDAFLLGLFCTLSYASSKLFSGSQ